MSTNTNKCTFSGRIGRDAEVRHLPNGGAVAQFTIAVNVWKKGGEEAMWVRCSMFGKQAEGGLIQYLVKGKQVIVNGSVMLNTWTNNEGLEKTSLEMKVDFDGGVELVGGQVEQQQPSGTGGQQYSQQDNGFQQSIQREPSQQQVQNQPAQPMQATQQQGVQGAAPLDLSDDIPFADPYKYMRYMI